MTTKTSGVPPARILLAPELARPSMSEGLREVLQKFLEERHEAYCLDLTLVDYLGSSSIAILLTFVLKVRERGGQSEILASSPDVLRALRLVRIDRLVALREAPREPAAG